MLIDTHCHLAHLEDADAVIARAKAAGVGAIIAASAEPDDFAKNIALCEKYENVFCTIGIHPEYATDCHCEERQLRSNLGEHATCLTGLLSRFAPRNDKIVGIGEIGLDYHYGAEHRAAQIELFRAWLEIARDAGLPVAIHTREAEDDTAEVLRDFDVAGVMHCFTGSWEFAKKMLDRGFYFSAGGIITFKNAADLRETFRRLPNDRIVIETDSPWLAPVPYRGKPCEPAMMVETAKVLAEIKGLQLSELEAVLEENTRRLFPRIV